MQPELRVEICELYQVISETRHKLEFLNQIYKLRASLLKELLHPQSSTSISRAAKSADNTVPTPVSHKYTPEPVSCDVITVSSSVEVDKEETAVTTENNYDFSQLDLLIQKSKQVRTDEKPQKPKNMIKKDSVMKEGSAKSPAVLSKSEKLKQTTDKLRISSIKNRTVLKSTYQASYSKRPPLLHKNKGAPVLPPILPDERQAVSTLSRGLLHSRTDATQQHKHSGDNEYDVITTQEPAHRVTSVRSTKDVPLTFPPPYQLPSLPSDYAEALRDLKRAQIELAQLLKSDQSKIFSPGKDFIRKFEELYRGEETRNDRAVYACSLYREIERESIPTDIKCFFLDSLLPHIPTDTPSKNTGFVYPCIHCTDMSRYSTEGIKVPRLFLLRELNLCSLLSQCYPRSHLSQSRLITRDRLQCTHLNQLKELQLLVIDVFSLSVKKDILSTCIKVVPCLKLQNREGRQVLRIILQILDSSKLISFYDYV